MSRAAVKSRAFAQELFITKSAKAEMLGEFRQTQDGRIFRYCKAGATALRAGKLSMAPGASANHVNKVVAANVAIGEYSVQVTVAAGTALAENELAGGYLQVNDATGEGYTYGISGNTELSSTGTSITVMLDEPIRKALVASTSEVSLFHSPWSGAVEVSTEESFPLGVPPVDVPANYYYWSQTEGLASVLTSGTPAVGQAVLPSATSGAVAGMTSAWTGTKPIIGTVFGTAGVNTEYKPIFLRLE